MADRGHNGHKWRKARAHTLAPADLVCFCGGAIDKRLRWPDPLSPSVDLIEGWAEGGDPLDPHNLRPAHLGCNSRRGTRQRRAARVRRQASQARQDTPMVRQWTTVDQP